MGLRALKHLNWPYITILERYPSRLRPTNFFREPKAKILTAEQEDREIGDYDIHIEIEQDTALKRVLDAEKFVQRIEKYLQT